MMGVSLIQGGSRPPSRG